MVETDKPKSVTITIQDRSDKKSKSFTVYNTDIDEVYGIVRRALKGGQK